MGYFLCANELSDYGYRLVLIVWTIISFLFIGVGVMILFFVHENEIIILGSLCIVLGIIFSGAEVCYLCDFGGWRTNGCGRPPQYI